jgi:hypothetical protein
MLLGQTMEGPIFVLENGGVVCIELNEEFKYKGKAEEDACIAGTLLQK